MDLAAMALPVASFGGFGRTPFSKDYNSAQPQRQRPCVVNENTPMKSIYPTGRPNAPTRDFKSMLEGMRQHPVVVTPAPPPPPPPAMCYQRRAVEAEEDEEGDDPHHTATLKRKLAIRGKQLKAAKRKISAVSKEKAGLEQQLALREQKLKVVMAAKDIYLNFNVDKSLYHDVMMSSSSSTTTSENGKKRPRAKAEQHPAVDFVGRVKRHLDETGRGDVVVTSSWEQEGGSSRKLSFNVDFWKTPGPIVVRDEVFQPEPMSDFFGSLADEHGDETVATRLQEAMRGHATTLPRRRSSSGSSLGSALTDCEMDDSEESEASEDEAGAVTDDEEEDYYSDDVEMMEDGGCRVVSGGRLGMALEALLAAGGGGQSIF